MSKKTIKEMRNELVEAEVNHIQEMSSKNLFFYAGDKTGYLDKKTYSDEEIKELYNNIYGGF